MNVAHVLAILSLLPCALMAPQLILQDVPYGESQEDIPDLPQRFDARFVLNQQNPGRWLYDWEQEKTVVEVVHQRGHEKLKTTYVWWLPSRKPDGRRLFVYHSIAVDSYQSSEPLSEEQKEGEDADSLLDKVDFDNSFNGWAIRQCTKYYLDPPFGRMPPPFVFKELEDLSTEKEQFRSFYESDEETEPWVARGLTMDHREMGLRVFPNETFTSVSLDGQTFTFTKFIDLSKNSNTALLRSGFDVAMKKLPEFCDLAGVMPPRAAARVQPFIPWSIYVPPGYVAGGGE